MKTYYVYIMANKSRTLYPGVTNNLERRVSEHRRKLVPGFTTRYNINRLVYYETFGGGAERHLSREADQGLASYEEGCFNRVY
jgi:predicted GIY-YIG superfamily endonuclease